MPFRRSRVCAFFKTSSLGSIEISSIYFRAHESLIRCSFTKKGREGDKNVKYITRGKSSREKEFSADPLDRDPIILRQSYRGAVSLLLLSLLVPIRIRQMLMPPRISSRRSSHSAPLSQFPPWATVHILSPSPPPSVSDPLFRLRSIIAIANCAPGCPSTGWLRNEMRRERMFLGERTYPRIYVSCGPSVCGALKLWDSIDESWSFPAAIHRLSRATRFDLEIFMDNILRIA